MIIQTPTYRVAQRLDLRTPDASSRSATAHDIVSVGTKATLEHGPDETSLLKFANGSVVGLTTKSALEKYATITGAGATAAGFYLTGEYIAKTSQTEISALLRSSNQTPLNPQIADQAATWAKDLMRNPIGQYMFVFLAGGAFGSGVVYAFKPGVTIWESLLWGGACGLGLVVLIAVARYFEVFGPTKVVP